MRSDIAYGMVFAGEPPINEHNLLRSHDVRPVRLIGFGEVDGLRSNFNTGFDMVAVR